MTTIKKKSSDYYFMFQTTGVPFLFSDICIQYYVPFDGVIFQRNNQYKQFISNDHIESTKRKYRELYKDKSSVESFCKEFDNAKEEFLAWGQQIKDADKISLEDFDKVISLSAKIQSLYSNVDPIYTDLLFEDSERDTERLKSLVLEKKNSLREDANSVFFVDDSPYILLQKKISEQIKIPFKDVSYLSIEKLRELVSGKSFVDLYKGNMDYAVIKEANSYTYLFGDEAKIFIEGFVEKVDSSVKELKGISVSKKGVYQGKVRKVVVDYEDFQGSLKRMDSSGEGYVLVADATIPELVPLMKKAVAIVTNVGGLLSHAAITSRELGIPCIVGTKIAVEILNEGDSVEVDADNGIVKIL